MKKFPKVIYVQRCEEGTQDEFLLVHEKYQDAAVVGERILVAMYELKAVKTVIAKPEIE